MGLSKPTKNDLDGVDEKTAKNMTEGMFAVKRLVVENFLKPLNKDVMIKEGFFYVTLSMPDKDLDSSVFSLVNIDVDLYDPYKQCIDFFYPRMVDGGLMLFDEYEFHGCPNSTKVINEFILSIEYYNIYRHGNRLTVRVKK